MAGPLATGAPFGVYVHVPFCASRCDYCAFATWTDRDHLMAAYAEACVTELVRATADEGLPAATSVFFGGGTPSRLPAAVLASVLDAVARSPGAEVTVECNPEDATAPRFARWRRAGSPGCPSASSPWSPTSSPGSDGGTGPRPSPGRCRSPATPASPRRAWT